MLSKVGHNVGLKSTSSVGITSSSLSNRTSNKPHNSIKSLLWSSTSSPLCVIQKDDRGVKFIFPPVHILSKNKSMVVYKLKWTEGTIETAQNNLQHPTYYTSHLHTQISPRPTRPTSKVHILYTAPTHPFPQHTKKKFQKSIPKSPHQNKRP